MTRLSRLLCASLASALAFAAFAQTPPAATPAPIELEMARQQDIYRSRGDATPRGYTIDRALVTYARGLSEGFLGALARLKSQDRWLDIGAGEGRAVLDYCTSPSFAMPEGFEPRYGERGRAVAMSIEDRRTKDWHEAAAALPAGRMEYLFGKPMGDYAAGELGQFQIITDVMGGFSYTPQLAKFVEDALRALVVDGTFYTVLADVQAQGVDNSPHYKNAPYLTRIRATDGGEVKICNWLKRIGCVEVSCEFRSDWTPPIEAYRIRKVCNEVKVPALELEHFAAGTPPERRFRLPEGEASASR